ncbi:hypothetical protein [Sporosarcina sp. A2]|uniref:hypothetical protein n=1 Tax=Sporosarcina sp. A2 TaxID=3393449 RepID=UPI003D7944E0
MLVDINLLPEKEKERSSFLYVALAVLGAALLFWLIFFLLTRSVTLDTERLEDQQMKLQVTQSELTARLNRSETAQSHDQLATSVQWAEDYRYETTPLLEDLVSLLPRRGFFRTFAFATPHQATIEVQFDDKMEAAYYLTRMLSSEYVETASIESVETEDIEEEENTAKYWLPRYVATYTIFFTDGRQVLDGEAPPVPENQPEENSPTETPVEGSEPATTPEPDTPVPEEEGYDANAN